MDEEIIEVVETETLEEIEVEETVGWTGGDSTSHDSLYGRNDADQHEIKAITGLRDELEQIKTLQTLYSNERGFANYYKWESGATSEYGYFVSLVPEKTTIQICQGSDIFGVTVKSAGFVGGQDEVITEKNDGSAPEHLYTRDNTYALVATSGLVDVRCESGVGVGDNVICNKDGIAQTTDSGCGYKVIALNEDGNYAVISLGVQACTTDTMGKKIQHLDKRIGDAEINIAAIRLVADEANSKATNTENQTTQDLEDIKEKVDNANLNASNANNRADDAYWVANDAYVKATTNHNETLGMMGELEGKVSPITGWVDPDNTKNIGAEYYMKHIEDGLSTKAEMEVVEKLNEENKLLIEQNAESYQQTISSVDKYVVGEYSTAYGLTLEQARKILKEGMVYIPTKHGTDDTHTEQYTFTYNEKTYTYTKSFTEGKYYVWTKDITLPIETDEGNVDVPMHMWKEGIGEVYPFDIVPSGLTYDYWYDGEKLYKLMTPSWKNVDKIVLRSSSEPTNIAFPYWYNNEDETIYKVTMGEEDGVEKIILEEWTTIVSDEEPDNVEIEGFWCSGNNIYQGIDAIWSKFDKTVYYGELDAATSEYDYCFYSNTLSVLSLNGDGDRYWQARSTYVGEDTPSYLTYDFWYDGKVLRSLWYEVNTLAANANGRITSAIKQTADSIATEVVNAHGSVAGFGAWLKGTEALAKMGTVWVDTESGEKTMASLGLVSHDGGSTMSLAVVNQDGSSQVLKGASINLSTEEDDSCIEISGDNINLNGYFSANNSFHIDEQGSMIATAGNIGGWTVDGSAITKVINFGTEEQPNYSRVALFAGAEAETEPAFYVTKSTSDNATVRINWDGSLKATQGQIGNWALYTDSDVAMLRGVSRDASGNDIDGTGVGMAAYQSHSDNAAFWAGCKKAYPWWIGTDWQNQTQFYVTQNGYLKSTSGNIAGWDITADKISKGDVGISSGDFTLRSLVDPTTTSPVRFYTGKLVPAVDGVKRRQLTFSSNGAEHTQSFFINDNDMSGTEGNKEDYEIKNASCVTTTYETTNTVGGTYNIRLFKTSAGLEPGGNVTYLYIGSRTFYNVLPVGVSAEDIISIEGQTSDVKVSYLGNGAIRVDVSTATATLSYNADVSITYKYNETLDVSVDVVAGKVSVTLRPKTIHTYTLDIAYEIGAKNQNFIVLADGSLYARNAQIEGTIYATGGEFRGAIHASNGNIGGLKITDGIEAYNGSFKLSDDGLTINNSAAKMQVGDVAFRYDDGEQATLIETSAALKIKGQNDTQLCFMANDGASSVNEDVYLYCKCSYANIVDTHFSVYLKINTACLYNNTMSIKCQFANAQDYILDTQTLSFTFYSGDTTTTTKVISYSSDIFEGTMRKVRFLLSDGSWSRWYTVNDTNDIGVGIVGKIRQYQKNNYIEVKGHLIPTTNSTAQGTGYNLGISTRHWDNVYARNGSIVTSDKQEKQDIEVLPDVYGRIFDALQPVSYKFKINSSNRTHIGLIAQDVKDAIENAGLTTQDFAGYCEWTNDDGSIGCGLRYGEFISICIDQIQKLKKRVAELETKLTTQQND